MLRIVRVRIDQHEDMWTLPSADGTRMPHVNIKLYPGKTEEQKAQLAEQIAKDVVAALGVDEKWISISMEEVETDDWTGKVYEPEILNAAGKLYKKPGYGPLA